MIFFSTAETQRAQRKKRKERIGCVIIEDSWSGKLIRIKL
jgi:hypothetical protein